MGIKINKIILLFDCFAFAFVEAEYVQGRRKKRTARHFETSSQLRRQYLRTSHPRTSPDDRRCRRRAFGKAGGY